MITIWIKNRPFIRLFFMIVILGCKTSSHSQITYAGYDDVNIMLEGRVGENKIQKASEIYWSGSSVKLNFEGTEIKGILQDQKGSNYFNVLIDNQPVNVLKLKKGKHEYVLAENLSQGKHAVQIIKRNEWTYGTTLFHGFLIKEGKSLPPDSRKKISIEFYGDSITTGHGNEDASGDDKPTGDVTNNYTTYAAITARKIDAEYTCIARGGIGVMVSWFNMIMPEMFDRLNPSDAKSKWDFSKKQPNIVVVNLFQNDSWIVNHPEHQEFKRRFGEQKPNEQTIINAYGSFIQKIRKHYPKASIVCLLGNMDITKEGSKWPSYVTSAVESIQDKNIFTCFVPFKDSKGHPLVDEHKEIARKLTSLIKSRIINKI